MTEQQLSHYEAVSGPAEPAPDPWRNEVHDRLAHYKRRRGRRVEGAYSMRFPFPAGEPVEPAVPAQAVAVAEPVDDAPEELALPEAAQEISPLAESTETVVAEFVAEPENPGTEAIPEIVEFAPEAPPVPDPEPAPFVDAVHRPRPKRKVIAFPRQQSVAHETAYRLADPVTAEVPRILDVPEELEAIPTTPFLDGLQFDLPNPADAARDREHVELPFRAVRLSQRMFAGIVDIAMVGAGIAVFAAVAYKVLASPPVTKPLVLGIVAAAVVLWSAYQYLFVVHAGKTLGMMAARLRLHTFKGKTPTLRQRRNRVLGFYLSALSLGMGLMWALVDVDGLCWHDRISQTYLAARD